MPVFTEDLSARKLSLTVDLDLHFEALALLVARLEVQLRFFGFLVVYDQVGLDPVVLPA